MVRIANARLYAVSKRKKERYLLSAVESHIRRHHPACPITLRQTFASLIAERSWHDASLGAAFGIVASNYVRHKLTDYDQLKYRWGLTRDEARLVVAREVRDIMAAWKMGPPAPWTSN